MDRQTQRFQLLQDLCLDRPREALEALQQLSQRSATWLEQRRWRLTASDAGAALGMSHSGSADPQGEQLRIKTGKSTAVTTNAMQQSIINESKGAEAYKELMQKQLPGCRVELKQVGLHVHPDLLYLAASFDRIAVVTNNKTGAVVATRILEVKCPKALPSEVPDVNEIQVLVQLAVADAWRIHDAHGAPPVDLFFWLPNGKAKLVGRPLDIAARNRWELRVRPMLANFFYDRLGPALRRLKHQEGTTTSAFVSPPRAPPPAASPQGTAAPTPTPTAPSPLRVAATPSLKEGKVVTTDKDKSRLGVVVKDLGNDLYQVRWQPSGKAYKTSGKNLHVAPLGASTTAVPPNRPGQQIAVHRGSFANQKGTTIRRAGSKWVVKLDGGAEETLEANVLHAKMADGEAAPEVSHLALGRLMLHCRC
jgi:hypothetical protein